jgi:hypothetical protein
VLQQASERIDKLLADVFPLARDLYLAEEYLAAHECMNAALCLEQVKVNCMELSQ